MQEKKRRMESSGVLPASNKKGCRAKVTLPDWLCHFLKRKGQNVDSYTFNTTMPCLGGLGGHLESCLQKETVSDALLSDEDTRETMVSTVATKPNEGSPLVMAHVLGFPCPFTVLKNKKIQPHTSNGVFIGVKV